MGAPSINVTFSVAARALATLSARGTVAVIVKDTKSTGGHTLRSAGQIPDDLSVANKEYIRRAFTGAVERPSRVLLYVLDISGEAEELDKALQWLGTQTFDWMCGAPDISPEDCAKVKEWIVRQRDMRMIPKAVLPNYEGDHYAVVNWCGEDLKAGAASYTAGEFCSRIAGLIAGTPYAQSVTYAPISELSDCKRLDPAAEDAAVDAGKLVPIHDGVKVKLSRGVNSLTTVTGDISASFKKIKFVEVYDRIGFELRRLIADNWIGKYTNNYDNECILLTAVTSFFQGLLDEGLIQQDFSVWYDVDGKREYLDGHGVDTGDMTDDEVKQYSADSCVFIAVRCKILDAIEDAVINVTLY